MDPGGERVGDEAGRKQHDDRGDPQPRGEDLRPDGQHHDQPGADQHLLRR
jgi:hypothetical protein